MSVHNVLEEIGKSGSNTGVIKPRVDDTGSLTFGTGSQDMDVKFFLGSTTEYIDFNVGDSNARFNVPIRFDNNTGAAAASGLLMGGGTTADPVTTSTADAKFAEFRCESTATSGDNRLLYMRYALEAAGGGETLRALTHVGANLGTAHGAHLSLDFEATAGGSECSGLGVACRGTLHIPDIASWSPTGTYAAGMFEIFSDGTASDPAGMTELSVLRLVNGGDGTGLADVDTDAFLLSIQGFTVGDEAADLVYINTITAATINANCTEALKIKVGANTRYIPIATATT